MKVKTYKKISLILFIILFSLILISFYLETMLISFLAVSLYLILISLLKTRVSGILADERQVAVSQKASQTSFQILMPILLLASLALGMGGGKQEYNYLKGLGIVLSYITCLGLLIYLITYFYFDKKSGGK